MLEVDFGEQRNHLNDVYSEFAQCLDDQYDAWEVRDRGIVTWVNQQADPPAAVAARWIGIAELGRNIDEGPGELFLTRNPLLLRTATMKHRWERLTRGWFKRPSSANRSGGNPSLEERAIHRDQATMARLWVGENEHQSLSDPGPIGQAG